MVVILDGLQLSGKTTLIDDLYCYKSYKFEFSKYFQMFNLKNEDMKGFQLGKDLATLYWLNELGKDKNIAVDRGVFSTIYYSLKYNRLSEEEIDKLIDNLKEFPNIKFVFVIKENSNTISRNKNDGFDDLDKELDLNILNKMKEKFPKLILFKNDFSKSPRYNRRRLYEYIRDKN